jgi:hypothetical protein
MDDDVASEVHRVEEGIKEAYLLVEECKGERQMRENEWKKRQEREKTETKEADSDFWLGV